MKGLEGIKEAVLKFIRGSDSYEKAVESFIKELQKTLIRADVSIRLVISLTKKIRERALKEEPPPGVTRRDWFIKVVYDCLADFFGGDKEPSIYPPKQPYTMMLIGIQGSGKTTTAAKIAYFYKKHGYRPGLISADTYRPAAYQQLEQLGRIIGAPVYGEPRSKDPIGIVIRGVKTLVSKGCNLIIVDTAGRHGYGSEQALLEEMKAIANALKPDEVVLVIDATMGQKAYDLAKRFHEYTPVGSIVLAKFDGSAKGGGALSAVAATGAIIKFIGIGEKVHEIEIFNPRRFVSRLLGLGDLESLLEKLKGIEEHEALQKRLEKALTSGRLSLVDIYAQIQAMKKLGPLSKILQMIPGLSILPISDEQLRISEKLMDKWVAIINSMTYEELKNPKIIDRRRMKRIALGSGTSIEDVESLLKYYETVNRMLKEVKRKKTLLTRLGIRGLGM